MIFLDFGYKSNSCHLFTAVAQLHSAQSRKTARLEDPRRIYRRSDAKKRPRKRSLRRKNTEQQAFLLKPVNAAKNLKTQANHGLDHVDDRPRGPHQLRAQGLAQK